MSDEGWEVVERTHIDTWRKAEHLLQSEKFQIGDQTFVLSVNFSQAIEQLNLDYGLLVRIFKEKDDSAMEEFNHNKVTLFFYVEEVGWKSSAISRCDSLVEYIIFEIFQAMNIASPGCFNLYRAELTPHPRQTNIFGEDIITDMSLSNGYYESSLYEAGNLKWLSIENLNLHDTLKWMRSVAPSFKMRPENPAAKALFALHHLVRSDAGPAAIIWLFYGLESLFQCRPGENFQALTRRISEFLEIDRDSSVEFKKRLRKIYDLRSAFVHGGHSVSHPLQNGLMSKEDEANSYQYIEETQLGVAIIIACIQRLIKLGWAYPLFKEIIQGAPLDSSLTPPPPSPPSPSAA